MSNYDTQAASIKRRRAIADALRASGNESLPASIQTSGRFDAPVSGWQYANKALQQVLSAYQNRQADKDEKKLSQDDAAELANVVAAKRLADTQENQAPAAAGDDLAEVPTLPKVNGKAALQAAALRGQQYGGQAGDVSGEILKRELFPTEDKEHVLGYGDVLYDKKNRPIAAGQDRPVAETEGDRALVNIVDPKSKDGFRTIRRADFKTGDQEWQKPTAGSTIAEQMTGPGLDLAAQRYRQTGILPTGMGRSPQTAMKLINRAAELAAADGDTSAVAALRMQFNKAGQTALGQLTKQQQMVGAFEKTAKANLNLARSLGAKVDRTGVPIVNAWINAGRKAVTGNADLAKFNAANETFASEYAKIMSGSMGSTAVSDQARTHAREMINTAMSAEAYNGVLDTLNTEMNNRIASFPADRKSVV